MKIKTKFDIGDKVFLLQQKIETFENQCDVCKGSGILHIQETGEEIKCNSCSGKGYNIAYETVFYKEDVEVISYVVSGTIDNMKIYYNCKNNNGIIKTYEENMLYTEKEADKQLSSCDVNVSKQSNTPFEYIDLTTAVSSEHKKTIPKTLY